MAYTDLRQIQPGWTHVVLSPHFDDAVFSLGGTIWRWSQEGGRVLVVTLMAGDPDRPLSSFAREHHRRWGVSDREAVARRRAEDEAALAVLGATPFWWLQGRDALYRANLYARLDRLFSRPREEDLPFVEEVRSFLEALRNRLPGVPIYAPLGVGGHVDHRIVAEVALDWSRRGEGPVFFYEELPYVRQPHALSTRLSQVCRTRPRGPAPYRIDPDLLPLSEAALTAKVEAAGRYASQVRDLFETPEAMAALFREHARQVAEGRGAGAERIWILRRR